jgi:hypothetical protein
MHLPGAERAVVEIDKLRAYCLDPMHSRGRHKARVFASAVGILQTDAEWLKEKILDAVRRCDATIGESDEYGQRYIWDFECAKDQRKAIIRTAWIVRASENFPRLITCYVLSD